LEDKIKEDIALKMRDRGQVNKWKKTPMDTLENLMEKEEGQCGKALKTWVKWT
jgi:hypothetical protein